MKESTLWKEYNWLYQKFTRTIDSIYKGCIDWMKKERLTLPRPILENFKMKFAISSTDSEEEPCRQKQRNRVLITEKTWKHNARFFHLLQYIVAGVRVYVYFFFSPHHHSFFNVILLQLSTKMRPTNDRIRMSTIWRTNETNSHQLFIIDAC